jgi:UDP-glucose 4-epimerase
MKITIIGGNGFIGSHLVDRLFKENKYRITVFGRSLNSFSETHKNVEYILGDFDDDMLLRKAIFGSDIVVHLLSTTVPSTANFDPVYDVNTNLIGTINLLKIVGEQNVKRFIYTSSGGTVYGNPQYTPMDENHPLQPVGSYGITKVAIESYIKMYSKKYGFSSAIIRPSNPYGPRQSYKGLQGVISTFLYKILTDQKLIVWGDGSAIRDYIYIDDVTEFLLHSIENDYDGIFNLGFGMGYSVNEIIHYIEECTSKKANVEYKNIEASNVTEVVLDNSKIKKVFKLRPKVILEEGIQNHYKWLISELERSNNAK